MDLTGRGRAGGAGYQVDVSGLPEDIAVEPRAVFLSRLTRFVRELFDETDLRQVDLQVVRRDRTATGGGADAAAQSHAAATSAKPGEYEPEQPQGENRPPQGGNGELDLEHRMTYFTAVEPEYDLSQVVLPAQVLAELELAVDTVLLRKQIFEDWGLREIEPHPSAAISLHGAPGTGKTMVAHALARKMGKKILPARASQLESKYHGEGGKYLDALFEAVQRADAVLFIDEAESLLSRRFESVSQGSEHAVNTLRSELIQHLDRYEGVVIFATNLISSYDPAFTSRLHHVRVPEPDLAARVAIWRTHLPGRLPLARDVDVERLARTEGIVGRDIKRVVINAAVAAARRRARKVTAADLEFALNQLLEQRPPEAAGADGELSAAERAAISVQISQEREKSKTDGVVAMDGAAPGRTG